MIKEDIKKIADDIIKIVQDSKATFFVNKDEKAEIPTDEVLYELKAKISTNIETYFCKLLTNQSE